MIFESTEKIGLKDIGKDNKISDEAILEILENVAGQHSNLVGYGALDVERTHLSWVLLEWKVKVIKRPIYSEILYVKTWGRNFQKAFTNRDFEIYNENNELLIIATSKWAMIDVDLKKIIRMGDEVKEAYKPEEASVFGTDVIEKIQIPDSFENRYEYKITRKDIDINNHMHNTYYMNLAYEVLPRDIFDKRPFDEFRISYKHELKYGETVICKYARVQDKYVIVVTNEDESKVNAIIELK